MKKLIIALSGLIMLLSFPEESYTQDEYNSGIGIALKASTNGLGGDISYGFHKNLGVRLGYESFSYDRDIEFSEQDIDYEAVVDARVGSVSLLLDYSPVNWFFLSGGLGYNLFHGEIIGEAASSMPFGDIEIPQEMIGDFQFDIGAGWKLSPYMGIGFGRPLSAAKTVSLAFELGSYYMGQPDISIQSSGLLSPTSNPDHRHEERLERQIDQYYLFPVMKLSLSFKLVKF